MQLNNTEPNFKQMSLVKIMLYNFLTLISALNIFYIISVLVYDTMIYYNEIGPHKIPLFDNIGPQAAISTFLALMTLGLSILWGKYKTTKYNIPYILSIFIIASFSIALLLVGLLFSISG